MTMSIVQCGGFRYKAYDLINNSPIGIDEKDNYIGLEEFEINSEEDLLKIFLKLEKLRYTS